LILRGVDDNNMLIFEESESNVRSYCRNFTDAFCRAKGSLLYSEKGKEYIDFFAGAGALNYGHNNDVMKEKVIKYIESDSIMHGLDMYTTAKREFMENFVYKILKPRNLDYKIQFCGSTGTNAVEAALKLSRKIKKRTNIFAFMGGFHGMSLGSLAATGDLNKRLSGGIPLNNVTFMPYPYGFMNTFDSIDYIESILNDDHSGIDKPAAIIFETVQAEGGVIVAPTQWMQRLQKLCIKYDILLICDDIQVGCGRTGPFFSFERAGIIPDIVLLSKSISGYGLPMSLLLVKPEYDIWKPGEHNGTFRGNQLAFISASAAIEYREQSNLEAKIKQKEEFIKKYLCEEIAVLSEFITIRGIGMIWCIDFFEYGKQNFANEVARMCSEDGLIIECCGRGGNALKILPPLNIENELLDKGCFIIKQNIIRNFKIRGMYKGRV
jgi:diaminobutyrate-2-oxoglutarate transaminase